MATEMELDAQLVLEALAEWFEQEDDPDKGHYRVTGAELGDKLGIPPNRINDAVAMLLDNGYVQTLETAGSSPYNFRDVWPEALGRQAYQRSQVESPNDDALGTAYDVFLSHSALDDALAGDVKHLLEVNGIRVFATPGSVPTGSWEPQIEEALRGSTTVWVLLTPNAQTESVWTHHEFGYFYGYNHGRERDLQGHSSRFLYTSGTGLRGLYAWIQGTQIDSFEDPILVARTIADGIGMNFHSPVDWIPRTYPQQIQGVFRHPTIGPIKFSSSGMRYGPGTAQVTIGIREINETIYSISALMAHPEVELVEVSTADIVGPSYPSDVSLHLQYREHPLDSVPEELPDLQGRSFNLAPGTRAPEGKLPLLITFETENKQAMAAVFYYTIKSHPKGFPELSLHTPVPLEWRQPAI